MRAIVPLAISFAFRAGTRSTRPGRSLTLKRLLVIGALVLLLGRAGTAAATLGPATGAGRVRVWSPQFFNGVQTYTVDEAVAVARSFDTIVALPTVFRGRVEQMKQANPSLELLLYMKGVFTYDTTLAEIAYAHDTLGQRIQGLQFPGTWLLDPSSPSVYAYDLDRATRLLATSGYDGVFLDTMGTAPLALGYVSGVPINQASRQPWTAPDWLAANADLAGRIAAATARPTIANGLRDGTAYFSPTAPTSKLLTTGLAGAMAEQWMRDATSSIDAYPLEAEWKLDVNAIADAGARGESFFAVTKAWTDGSQAQKDAWNKFAVASFLLGNDGTAYLHFTYSPGDSTTSHPLDNLDLGTPMGPYAKAQNVYQRQFSNGRVLVNPRAWTFKIGLDATYHTLDGTPVTAVTLRPYTAEILRP